MTETEWSFTSIKIRVNTLLAVQKEHCVYNFDRDEQQQQQQQQYHSHIVSTYSNVHYDVMILKVNKRWSKRGMIHKLQTITLQEK